MTLKIVFNPIEGKFDLIDVSNGSFQRNLVQDLALKDGEALVTVGYINTGSYSIDLDGDAAIMIL